VVRRLLAAVANSTTSSHMCHSVGAGTAAGGLVYGLTRCAAGISCADCRRCLGGALEVVDREYNGSAGMQVLRLSCMARYESYPFYNTKSLARRLLAEATSARSGMGSDVVIGSAGLNLTASGRNPPPPSPPAQARAPPPAASRDVTANTTVFPGGRTGAAQPTPVPPGGHTPRPAAAAPNGKNYFHYCSLTLCILCLRHSPIVFYFSVLLFINPVSVVQDCRLSVFLLNSFPFWFVC
jgi:hypothetical protein